MKKFIFIITFILLFSSTTYAISPSDISAECACVMDLQTGKILFSKNENMRHAMASTTKIMTALIALLESKPDDLVLMSANAAATEGSSVYVPAGQHIKMIDLLYGLMLNSGNDAAVAIAEHISGNVVEFCKKMNDKAKELGLSDTSFKNPNGLFEEGHYSSASDLAQLTRIAMKNEDFCNIIKTKTKTAVLPDSNQEIYFTNHNKLLWNYEGAIGVKTGYTKDTGRCLVSAATKDHATLICVTLDAPNDWADHTALLDYGFSKVEAKLIIEKDQVLKTSEINGKLYDFIAEDNAIVTTLKNQNVTTLVNLKISETLTGPFEKGEKVGVAEIILNGEIVDTVDIISKDDIFEQQPTEKIIKKNDSFFIRLLNIFLKLFLYA